MKTDRILHAKYLKEPGYISDLIFLFCIYFNKKHIMNTFVNYDKAKEDITFYNEIYNKIGLVPAKLALFFHFKIDTGCLISKYYLCKQADIFLEDEPVTVKRFTELFQDTKRMTEAVNKFYFPQAEQEKMEQMSLQEIAQMLETMDYSNDLKYQILNYYIRPEDTIQLLIDTMRDMEPIVQEYYAKYEDTLQQMVEEFDIYQTVENLNRFPAKSYSIELFEPIYYSVSVLDKVCVKFMYLKTDIIILLGWDYPQFLDFLLHQSEEIELDLFGKILSEENRIKILDMLLERVEVTKTEVSKALGISMTATHYHMDMMVQARMLTVRNEGRTMYHSLNRKYFAQAIEMLMKYSIKKKGGVIDEAVEMPGY